MPRPVVWFEITGNDTAKLNEFYSEVFDWTVNADNPMNYGIVEGGEQGIGERGEGAPGGTFYIEVPDLQAALNAAEAARGKTVQEPMEIPGMVALAMFADPDGIRHRARPRAVTAGRAPHPAASRASP